VRQLSQLWCFGLLELPNIGLLNLRSFATLDCCLISWVAHPSILARACTCGGLPHCFWRFRSFPIPLLSPLEWPDCMEVGHGYTDIARSAVLRLCMTPIGSCGALSVCVDFATATLLTVAPFVVTLTVIIALEIMNASEMHC
jgi:hypothetical protein